MANPIDIKTRRPRGEEHPELTFPPAYYDVAAVRLAIMRVCPSAVRDLLGHAAITGLAQAAIRTLDQTRQARAADPTADRRSEAHDWVGGLAEAYSWGRNLPPVERPDPEAESLALQQIMQPRHQASETGYRFEHPDESA